MTHSTHTLAIVLTYFKPESAINTAYQLINQQDIDVRVVIVDNSCDKVVEGYLLEHVNDERIKLLVSKSNSGYAVGNNAGFDFGVTVWGFPKYVLFSNDDIVVNNKRIVSLLSATIENNLKTGCVQPRIVLSNGFIQGPYPKSNIAFDILKYTMPFVWYFYRSVYQSYLRRQRHFFHAFRVMGAFFMIDAQRFCQSNMFDVNTFLGCEEEILALKLANLGLKSSCLANVEVQHLQDVKSATTNRYFYQSTIYLYSKIYRHNSILIAIYKLSYYIFHHLYLPIFKLAIRRS